ncbi:MAG: site-specific DNA-methyltransferase [Paludibacteraceae bacterium]|nr:site-specific DNA-methyltransferase [Paludibacteraceae bacterium]
MSTNLSKLHREELLDKIQQIRTFIAKANQDENTQNLLQYLNELTKDVKGKKYGLVFEEHRESIDETLENNLPVLTEDESLFINNGGQMNFLIEGDNLASLKLLEKTHKGKIDIIYIDPPYNTGAKDWKYNNDYVDDNDTFRHSKWASMMCARLSIAKNLLTDNGILVCAIDHYELYQIGMILDTLFGEDNRIGICAVVHKPEGRNQEKFFGTSHEYALYYAKNKNLARFNKVILDEEMQQSFDKYDEQGAYKRKNFIRLADGKYATREAKPNFWYPIYVSPELNNFSLVKNDGWFEIFPVIKSGVERTWKTLPATFMKLVAENSIEADFVDGRVEIYEKLRENQVIKSHWIKKEYHAYHFGSKILNEILGTKKFDFPKSLFLMRDIFKLISPRNATILDFFAGSGTTGHAVMKLNSEDGGQRKFILCTNNENNICRDVTYERIKRVIDKENYSASLKYFKVDFVPITDKLYYEYADDLLKYVRGLVELENGINFNGNAEIAILLTDAELDAFMINVPIGCKTIYIGHNVLPNETHMRAFQQYGISIKIIPEYYYRNLEA